VRSVVVESPAARAGVKTGDRVLEIDDLALAGVGLVAAQHLLSGPAGTAVRVRVGPPGHGRRLRLARVALL
jgi:C-terminal processing protease CtpA/Prc